jgi:hypothetical protein
MKTVDITKIYDFSKATVKCDEENNPPDLLQERQLRLDIIIPGFNHNDWLKVPKMIDRDIVCD